VKSPNDTVTTQEKPEQEEEMSEIFYEGTADDRLLN